MLMIKESGHVVVYRNSEFNYNFSINPLDSKIIFL